MLEPNKCSFSTYSQLLARKVDVEQLKLEQNYQPTTSEELSVIAAEADIEQSIEELLYDLKSMG